MQETLVPMGPPKKRKSPRSRTVEQAEAGTNISGTNETESLPSSSEKDNISEPRIPMLIRGIGVQQVIPKEATRDVLNGKVAFYLVDDRDGVTFFPPKHIFSVLKLDHQHVEYFEDYTCLGGHQRRIAQKPKKKEGMGYRRKYIDPELLQRGIYSVEISIRIKALMLLIEETLGDIRRGE